ncbi:ISPsy24, transposase orfB [Pseudomonas coronafaciens pv. zizaniae]|nr:ISPsy24, transposase orfB [Pseudomonas coronafaciens pv. zizaniae]
MDFQVLDTAPFLDVADLQLRCFFAAQAVVEQHRQNGPIAQALKHGACVGCRGWQTTRLLTVLRPIAEIRRRSACASRLRRLSSHPACKSLGNCYDNSPMERVFRSLKTEWIPAVGYMTAQEAQRDISHYLMHRYNWVRPHQFNDGLAPAQYEKNLNVVSGIS